MKKYDAYKPSGVDWIGEVPNHWTRIHIKHTTNGKGGLFIDGDWIESKDLSSEGVRYLTSGNVGVIKYKEQGEGYITEDKFQELNCTEVFPGDILISRLNEPIGRACIVPNLDSKIVVAVDNVICRVNDLLYDKRYLVYEMNCKAYSDYTNCLARGTGMHRISRGMLGQINIVIPSLTEQTAIAEYLDAKCAKIDNVVAKQQKRIELLKELKQSIITKAVTKGLDKNAKMKDSSVEWIGEVPNRWKVMRIKYVAKQNENSIKIGPFGSALTGKIIENGECKVYGQWNIIDNDFSVGNNSISRETYNELITYKAYPKDILISMMGTVGKCAIIPNDIQDGVMDSHVVKIRLEPDLMDSNYFEYVYDKDNSLIVYEQIQKSKKGSIMDGLNSSLIKDFIIPVPPLEEQTAIVLYLDKKCAAIDRQIAKIDKQIELLKEYKQSVITECVTGKRKVC